MKNAMYLLLLFVVGVITNAVAQTEATNQEKMKVFAGWVGRWQGQGWMQMGPGEPKKSTIDEKIEAKLDGMVYLVEGIGKSINPETKQEIISHHALALLSYDNASGSYKFRSHLKDGRSTEAWFTVTGENTFQWGFDIPNRGKTRYSIKLDPKAKTWNEIGEYSADGTSWSKFFEMNLTKTE
jgi:hypothetical protein